MCVFLQIPGVDSSGAAPDVSVGTAGADVSAPSASLDLPGR